MQINYTITFQATDTAIGTGQERRSRQERDGDRNFRNKGGYSSTGTETGTWMATARQGQDSDFMLISKYFVKRE